MFKVITTRMHQGHRTSAYPRTPIELNPRFRGLPIVNTACDPAIARRCADLCPQEAIDAQARTIDLGRCTFCGLCADFCAKKSITLTQDCIITGTTQEDFLVGGTFIKKAPPKPKFTPEQLAAMKAAAEAKKAAAARPAPAAE